MPRWAALAVALWVPFAASAWGSARLVRWGGGQLGERLARVSSGLAPSREVPEVLPPLEAQAEVPVDQAPASGPDEAPSAARPAPARTPAARPRAPVHGLHVPAPQVLRLARAGILPAGEPVPASGSRPAGLALRGVAALGIGLRDGDVLTDVAGVPASSADVVIRLVLAARSARAPSMSGRVWRGDEPWTLVVEMPYPG